MRASGLLLGLLWQLCLTSAKISPVKGVKRQLGVGWKPDISTDEKDDNEADKKEGGKQGNKNGNDNKGGNPASILVTTSAPSRDVVPAVAPSVSGPVDPHSPTKAPAPSLSIPATLPPVSGSVDPNSPTKAPAPSLSIPSTLQPVSGPVDPNSPTKAPAPSLTTAATLQPVSGQVDPHLPTQAPAPSITTAATLPPASGLEDSHSPTIIPVSRSPTTFPTIATTDLSTNQMIISRKLFPFTVSLDGDEDQFDGINMPLKFSLEFFMESKMKVFFPSLSTVRLEETTLVNIQRKKMISRDFGYVGEANFEDNNVPTTSEVHEVQRKILSEFMSEWEELLKENGIFLFVKDVQFQGGETDPPTYVSQESTDFPDDRSNDPDQAIGGQYARNGGGDSTEDDSSQFLWVALAAAALVLAVGFVVVRSRRTNGMRENRNEGILLEEDECVVPENDLMMDTSSDTQPLTWMNVFRLSTEGHGLEEFEDYQPNPETEFMNVPTLESPEVVHLQSHQVNSDSEDFNEAIFFA